MTRRRVQSISPKDPMALQKVIEALEVSEGVRGAPGDRKPTVAEVQQMIAGGGAVPITGTAAGGATGGGQSGSQIVPSRPSGLLAIVIQDGIVIGWDRPAYNGHGKTEVWRSATSSLDVAIQIGVTGANAFVDYQAGNSQSWHYFLRHVVDVSLGTNSGPFSAGLAATSAPANQVLTAAKDYTDSREIQIRDDMDTGDSATLTAAKSYTDNRETAAVQSANDYTDDQIAGLSIIPDAPSDGKMYVRQNGDWVELPA